MSIRIKIKEGVANFFVVASLENGEDRIMTTAQFDPDESFDSAFNSRDTRLNECICYVHGVSDGMNLLRSITPLVTYDANPEKV